MLSVSRVRNYPQLCHIIILLLALNSLLLLLFFLLRSPASVSQLPSILTWAAEPLYIQFSDSSKCVGVREGVLVVSHCRLATQFLYNEEVLRLADNTESCVVVRVSNIRVLQLGQCGVDAVHLRVNHELDGILQLSESSEKRWHKEASCVSTRDAEPDYDILGENDEVALRFCSSNPIRARLVPLSRFIIENKVTQIVTRDPLASNPPYNQPCTACKHPTGEFWVQFSHEGRCMVPTNNNLIVVGFCDPNRINEKFIYSNGILMTSSHLMTSSQELCVGVDKTTSRLILGSCQEAIRLLVVDGELKRPALRRNRQFCVQPESKDGSTPAFSPSLGTRVVLGPCKNIPASSVSLIPEKEFVRDRAALLLQPGQELTRSCPFPACAINHRPPPPKLLPEGDVVHCSELSACVTVVVKTARRPWFVIRLVNSIRDHLGTNVPVVVIDDGPDLHPPEVMQRLSEFPNMRYVIAEEADLGIAEGRMRGVLMVQTRYFLSFDDDFIVTNTSDIKSAVDLMDRTDLSVVGAKGATSFAGNVDFVLDSDMKPALRQVYGSCIGAEHLLPFKKECRRCDLTINCFLARTSDVIQAGGWSRELKVSEHLDFFLRLKAAKKKVAICANFLKISHEHNYEGLEFAPDTNNETKPIAQPWYWRLRWSRTKLMTSKFLNHWNIHKIIKRTKGAGQEDEGVFKADLNETQSDQNEF